MFLNRFEKMLHRLLGFGLPADWFFLRCCLDIGGDDAPQPDPAIGKASKEAVELGREQHEYAKTVINPWVMDIANRVTDQQLGMMQDADVRADEQWNQYVTMFAPLEQRMVLDSFGYDLMPEAEADSLLQAMTEQEKQVLAQQYQQDIAQINESITRARGQPKTKTVTTTTKTEGGGLVGGAMAPTGHFTRSPMFGFGHPIYGQPAPQAAPKTTTTTKTITESGGFDPKRFQEQKAALQKRYQQSLQRVESKADLIRQTRDSEQAAIEAEAGRAGADVSRAYEAERGNLQREMGRMGINPTSGRYQGLIRNVQTRGAADTAGAMTQARARTRDALINRRSGTAHFGRNMPATSGQQSGLSLNAGSSATGNTNAAAGTVNAGRNSAAPWYNTGIGGMNQQFGNQLNAWQANDQSGMFGLIGQAVGGWAGGGFKMPSSKQVKKDKRKVRHAGILEKVRELPVEEWEYTDDAAAKTGDPRAQPGVDHIGPYAENFRDTFGVGDGKTIHPADQGGIILSAIKALDQKVERLERRS